jgi:hypothetical protein
MWWAAGLAGRIAANKIANEIMGHTLNRDEAYVDRIKREFRLREYHQARLLYESNPAYWQQLYGSDPVTSRNHPAAPPAGLLPRQVPLREPGENLFDPSPMSSGAFRPFSRDEQRVGAGTASLPRDGLESRDGGNAGKPVRRLSSTGDTAGRSAFDSGAPAVPAVVPRSFPGPDEPATFDERFPAADELEAFRRHWLRSFMQP